MRTLVLIGTIAMFISCNNNVVFDDYKTFSNQEWNTDSLVTFNYTVSDTACENIIKIKLRHTVDYEFQNLFLFVKAEQVDTIELVLANKEGLWLGTGIGDIREFEFEHKNTQVFANKGERSIVLEQAMRYGSTEKIQVLNNISAIGLSIEKQDE
jgi:gliding motility-associated lipoprotein GldH